MSISSHGLDAVPSASTSSPPPVDPADLRRRIRRRRALSRPAVALPSDDRSVKPTSPDLQWHRDAVAAGPLPPTGWRIAALVLVLMLFWLPRGFSLDRLVTPDEPLWLARSANFTKALSDAEWGDSYQYVHPGVMTMWMGSIGYLFAAREYPDNVGGQIDQRNNRIAKVLRSLGWNPLDVLATARAVMVAAMTLIAGVTFWQASRLLGLSAATIGFVLIALDPFQTSLSRILHVDALDSAFGFLCLIAFLNYLERGRNLGDLALSGAAAGFAWLTRSQSLFLVPFVGLLLVGDLGRRRWSVRRPRFTDLVAVEKPLVGWGIAGLFVVVAAWPAMWTRPIFAMSNVLKGALNSAEAGHERPIYFLGQVYDGNPGLLFYPVSFLWRTNPPTMAGLALALILIVIRPGPGWSTPLVRRVVLSLLLYSALFTILMTVAAKKFDRYLLPVYAPLAIVAGCGWWACYRWLAGRDRPVWRWAGVAALCLLLLVPASSQITTRPYYFSAYNPLLALFQSPDEPLMIGWGEGTDQVAAFLDQHYPDESGVTVAVDSWPSSLTYFSDRTLQPAAYFPGILGLRNFLATDLYVRYITANQRGYLHPDFQAALDAMTPLFTVRLSDMTYAQLYDLRQLAVPAYLLSGAEETSVWDGTVRLLASRLPGTSVAVRAGTRQEWTIYFQDLPGAQEAPASLGLRLQLLDMDGNQILSSEGPLARETLSHGVWSDVRTVTIPWGTMPGTYRVVQVLYDLDTGLAVPALDARSGVRLGPTVQAGCIGVEAGVSRNATGC